MKRAFLFAIIVGILFASEIGFAGNSWKKVHGSHGKRTKMRQAKRPQELSGSRERIIEQNTKANNLGIGQFLTEKELEMSAANNVLTEIRDTDSYFVGKAVAKKKSKSKTANRKTEARHIFVQPWAKMYLDRLAPDYFSQFHKRLKITSGARSLRLQHEMTRRGSPYYTPYAIKARNPLEESLHVRGIAIDISRAGMSREEIKWMRKRLIEDKIHGIEFETENQEEFGLEADPIEEKICFHIVVFPKN